MRANQAVYPITTMCRVLGLYQRLLRVAGASALGTRPGGGATLAVVLGVGAVAVFLLLGNFRVVSGTPNMFVARQNFGFDDTFAKLADCTSSPWIVASAQHGPLCSDLQAAGILESDESRDARIQAEVQREMRQMHAEVAKKQRELMTQMEY